MNDAPIAIPRYMAMRYVSVGKRSQLVSFMSAISIAGLALGIAILIIVLSVMNGFDREMRENVLGIVPHITVSSDENLSAADWDSIITIAESNSRVRNSAPVINAPGVLANDYGNKAVLVNGIDPILEPTVSKIDNFVLQGSLRALQESKWGILLGSTLASQLQLAVGDSVDLFSTAVSFNPITPLATFKSFEVVGIYRVGSEEIDSELAFINIQAARSFFKLRTPFNGLRLSTVDVLAAEDIRRELAEEMPSDIRMNSWRQNLGGIYDNIQFSRSIISFMLWLLIVVAAFNLVVSLIMIVRDKRADIAILRTLGASPSMINRIFMWQGGLIGLIGISIGVVLGVLGSLQISNIAAAIESAFSIQLLNAEIYPIDFLPSQLKFIDVVIVAAGVFVLALLATIYPARRAAAIQPAEALRSE